MIDQDTFTKLPLNYQRQYLDVETERSEYEDRILKYSHEMFLTLSQKLKELDVFPVTTATDTRTFDAGVLVSRKRVKGFPLRGMLRMLEEATQLSSPGTLLCTQEPQDLGPTSSATFQGLDADALFKKFMRLAS